ncbi:MAG TPA: DMT family transporter [Candidatus Binatia bacterium]
MKTADAVKSFLGATEWFLLIALSIIWGGSFFFVSIALRALPPLTIVWLRLALAAVVLRAIALVQGLSLASSWRLWVGFGCIGLLNNIVPYGLIAWGQTHIASGLASILNAATPFSAVIVAHFFTDDEKMTRGRVAGVLVGFTGVVVMIGPDALRGLGAHIFAQLAVLGAGISYSVGGVASRRFRALGVSTLGLATNQAVAATLILLPVTAVIDRPWTLPVPGPDVWGAVLGLGLFSTALAYIIYFRLLATAGATNALLVTFLIPVSAILLGTMFLGERLEPKHFAGMGLIGLGLAVMDGRLLGFLTRRQNAGASPAAAAPDRRRDRT